MCGICGSLSPAGRPPASDEIVRRMLSRLRHRGPDETGWFRGQRIVLGHARLSIIDPEGGKQPIANEDQSLRVILNGEIFNYLELREGLAERGHRFYTRTDTEVLLHLYEEKGEAFLSGLNGQFALALWDQPRQRLLLARDRFGVAPLFYSRAGGEFLFASEIKSLLAHPGIRAEWDPFGLDQLFTFWSTLPPRTLFKGICELPPAHYLTVHDNNVRLRRYWDLEFPDAGAWRQEQRGTGECGEEFLTLLLDSIRLRLRADVPVGAFVSGGLDSSLIAALTRSRFHPSLQTYAVRFADAEYDESRFQRQVAGFLGATHQEVTCSSSEIGRIMPAVVWHAERPLVRTAPAPMYLLARQVRRSGIKVVLTGEGADEIMGGYDLFREMKIRRFWAKRPSSAIRPLLLQRLYPYLPNWPRQAQRHLETFYRGGLGATSHFGYSHLPRWETTAWVKRLFSEELKRSLRGYDAVEELAASLPRRFSAWEPLAQAQYLEIQTLLAGNLLSSQGDRMVMAHGVEARQPFLDHRLAEFCARLPPRLRICGLQEKYLLKKAAEPFLPWEVASRPKQAYRAPDAASFFGAESPAYMQSLTAENRLARSEIFQPQAAVRLLHKCRVGGKLGSVRENLAAVGVLTTLMCEELFFAGRADLLHVRV